MADDVVTVGCLRGVRTAPKDSETFGIGWEREVRERGVVGVRFISLGWPSYGIARPTTSSPTASTRRTLTSCSGTPPAAFWPAVDEGAGAPA